MPEFGPDIPVVRPDHVQFHSVLWLLWPALRYRVVAPLVHEQRLDVFQAAVLGLARAGFREAGDIGRVLALQNDLVELVRSDLRTLGHLDKNGAITATGRAALKDGFPDPTRSLTTYVYQDVSTGTLWPASTVEPSHAPCDWKSYRNATLQLRTAGAPLRARAFAVAPDGWTGIEPPGHEHVVEAVSRGEAAKRQGGGGGRRWDRSAPERIVSRVSLITSGQPVWIPLPLQLRKREEGGETTVTWDAVSPFSGRASTYLRRLVATRVQQSSSLREQVERFIGRRTEVIMAEYDLLDIGLRRRIAETLEDRFTQRIREHKALFELLTLLERDIGRVRRTGDGSAEAGDVVRNAWRLHEAILRDIVARHRPAMDIGGGAEFLGAPQLGAYCRQLGMSFAERVCLQEVRISTLDTWLRKPEEMNRPRLLTAAVVSAAHGGTDHPFARLAAIRPNLLTELTNLARDRNAGGAHAEGVPLNSDYGESAWRLAQDTTAAYLDLPLPAVHLHDERSHNLDGQG